MRLREEPRWDCVLACLCRSQQTQSFDHVFDMELDSKLNFVVTQAHVWPHKEALDGEWETERGKKKGGERTTESVFVWLFIVAVSVWIEHK